MSKNEMCSVRHTSRKVKAWLCSNNIIPFYIPNANKTLRQREPKFCCSNTTTAVPGVVYQSFPHVNFYKLRFLATGAFQRHYTTRGCPCTHNDAIARHHSKTSKETPRVLFFLMNEQDSNCEPRGGPGCRGTRALAIKTIAVFYQGCHTDRRHF